MEGSEFYKDNAIEATEFTFTSRYINDTEKKYIKDLSSLILGIALEELKWSQKKNLCCFKWLGDVDVTSEKFMKFRTELDMLLTHRE